MAMTETELRQRRIRAAIATQDQMVFSYDKGDGRSRTRFVVPLELIKGDSPEESQILCKQLLPKTGYRRFRLSGVKSVFRVTTRMEF